MHMPAHDSTTYKYKPYGMDFAYEIGTGIGIGEMVSRPQSRVYFNDSGYPGYSGTGLYPVTFGYTNLLNANPGHGAYVHVHDACAYMHVCISMCVCACVYVHVHVHVRLM